MEDPKSVLYSNVSTISVEPNEHRDPYMCRQFVEDVTDYLEVALPCCPTRSMNMATTRWMEMRQGISCSSTVS
jgi:hypothetical protein